MDDDCRPHRANLVEDFLFEEGIVRTEWPASSSDMNPIEHWLDNPRWALAFSRSLFHASLLPASVPQFLVLKTRSFPRPSIHPRFGQVFLRMPIGWTLKTSLEVQSSSILTKWPAYLIRCTELTHGHILDCPAILAAVQEIGFLFSSTNLYVDNIGQIARTVI
ncbi:hypothetical protein TNCV_751251 [Trichonephila clavipes]|nr:hypothetical protein TNCV_751251 [Trichonephila clavipes]